MSNSKRPFFRYTSKELIAEFEKSKKDLSVLKQLVHEIPFRKKAKTSLKPILEKVKKQIDLIEGNNDRPFFRHTSRELLEQFDKSKNNITELKLLLDEISKRKKATTVLKPVSEKIKTQIISLDQRRSSESQKTVIPDIRSKEQSLYKKYANHFGRVPSGYALKWMPKEQFDALATQALRENKPVEGWDTPVKG